MPDAAVAAVARLSLAPQEMTDDVYVRRSLARGNNRQRVYIISAARNNQILQRLTIWSFRAADGRNVDSIVRKL